MSEAIMTVATDGEILACNVVAEKLFGYGKGELRGSPFTRLQSGDSPFEETLNQLDRGGSCRLFGRERSGGRFPLQLHSVDRMNRHGRAFHTVVVRKLPSRMATPTEDLPIDRLLARLHEERDQRKLKEQCISMMSHELRTPLASIQLSHDMLAQYSERATPEERQKYLENIRLQVKNLNEIVSDVVHLSRSYQSDLEFRPARQDLVAFCREIVESFAITYQQTHQVRFECAQPDIFATFDWKLLRRALTNLLGNAIKYAPDGGRVELHLWRDGDQARLTISDTGIGIPAEDMPYLFQAFHRAANVGALPGTGLGLAIVKQALDLHNAKIQVSSQVNVGTTIELALPLRLAASPLQVNRTSDTTPQPRPISA